MKRIIKSWQLSANLHEFREGASEADLTAFEKSVGWALPAEWRELYHFSNGSYLLQGNLSFFPLCGEELSLLQASDAYKSWKWPIPTGLWIAGDNGGGEPFGLWVPRANAQTGPVVAMGGIFEANSMALAGMSLKGFLTARTAYYLLLLEASAEALDAIEVPVEFRAEDPNDEHIWAAIAVWADPGRAGISDDPYEVQFDSSAINEAFDRVE